VFLLTDGEDTEVGRTSIPVGLSPTGELVHREVHTASDRRTAVIDFLENVALCDVHVLGVGNEVKDLVTTLSRGSRIVAGHVDCGANPREMIGLINAVLSETPDTGLITVDSPSVAPPSDGDEEWIAVAAKDVVVGLAVDALFLEQVLFAAETSLGLPACAYTRAAIAWFMLELRRRGPLPGAVIGGKRTRVFQGPPDRRRWASDVNALLSKMVGDRSLVALGKREGETSIDVNGRVLKYSNTPHYDISPCVPLVAVEELVKRHAFGDELAQKRFRPSAE
jgi:hypothetical protein